MSTMSIPWRGRRRLIGTALAWSCWPSSAIHAQVAAPRAWPTRALRLLVPAGPGSVPDVRARWLAERLGPLLGQSVIVDNRPGAGGVLAMEQAARAEPDGHTLVMTHAGLLVLNPLMYERLPYDTARDFVAVTRVGVGPLLLLVAPGSPWQTFTKLAAAAAERSGALSFASQGIGTPPHLAGEALQQRLNVQCVHVPYTNPAQPIADLLGGRIDWLFEGTPVALPLVRAGRLRALAVTAPTRLGALPEVPSMTELGHEALVMSGWNGIAAPAATPADAIDQLYLAIKTILGSAEAQQWFGELGNTPGGESPAALVRLIADESQRWAPVVRAAGIRLRH